MNKINRQPRCKEMYRAILKLKTIEECENFFDDLCTVTELRAMEQRYQVASLLDKGMITTSFRKQVLQALLSAVSIAACATVQADMPLFLSDWKKRNK